MAKSKNNKQATKWREKYIKDMNKNTVADIIFTFSCRYIQPTEVQP